MLTIAAIIYNFKIRCRLKTRENVDDGDLEEGFKASSKTTTAKEEDLDKNRMTLIASPNKVSAPSVGGNANSSSIPKSTVAAVWQKQNTTEENVLQLQTKSTAATTTDCSTIEQPQNILHSSSSSNVNDLNSNNNCNNINSNLLIQDVLCIKSYLHQLQKVLECQKQNELTSLPVDINSVNGGYQQGGKLYQNNNNLYANND